jgi:hypothetical protein
MDFKEYEKEEPSWGEKFWESFRDNAIPVSDDEGLFVLFLILLYCTVGAAVAAVGLSYFGWLRGYSVSGGWAFSAFTAFGLHMGYSALIALWSGTGSFLYYRSRYRDWLKHHAEQEEARRRQQSDALTARRRLEAKHLLDELIEAAEQRRLAPARAAQARAERLALLERQLDELFNRYRFSCDVTGTGDLNMLRQGFRLFLQANQCFSAEDMALLSSSGKGEVRALLPKLNA